MTADQRREERALEGLIVSAFRIAERGECDSIREPNERERAAIELLGPDFMDRLLAGSRQEFAPPAAPPVLYDQMALAGDFVGGVLNRADDVDEATAKELKEKEEQIAERKRKEKRRHEETS